MMRFAGRWARPGVAVIAESVDELHRVAGRVAAMRRARAGVQAVRADIDVESDPMPEPASACIGIKYRHRITFDVFRRIAPFHLRRNVAAAAARVDLLHGKGSSLMDHGAAQGEGPGGS